jgi:hypothetical protein
MGIIDKSEDVRNAVQLHRLEAKLDRARSELGTVDAKNQELREQLDRERTMVRSVTATPRHHSLRRVFVLAAAAGGAYVAGTAAGRERYRQIRERFDRMKDRGGDMVKDVASNVTTAVKDDGALSA